MEKVLNYITSSAFIGSVITIVITCLLLNIIKKYLIKKVAYKKGHQHQNTLFGVVFNILQYIVLIVCVVIVLSLNGVNIAGIFTGLGIGAAIIGLALQDTIKDIISGINIYNNNFYKVGDAVLYNGELCDVKYFNARVTKFQSMYTQDTFTVCNSLINSIEKVKNNTVILLYFDFDNNMKTIEKCFKKANEKAKDIENLNGTLYLGIVEIENEGVKFGCILDCPAHKSIMVKTNYLTILTDEFKKAKISPSFNDERKVKVY